MCVSDRHWHLMRAYALAMLQCSSVNDRVVRAAGGSNAEQRVQGARTAVAIETSILSILELSSIIGRMAGANLAGSESSD